MKSETEREETAESLLLANTSCVHLLHSSSVLTQVTHPHYNLSLHSNNSNNQHEEDVGVCFCLFVIPQLFNAAAGLILCIFITQAQGMLPPKAKSVMT